MGGMGTRLFWVRVIWELGYFGYGWYGNEAILGMGGMGMRLFWVWDGMGEEIDAEVLR